MKSGLHKEGVLHNHPRGIVGVFFSGACRSRFLLTAFLRGHKHFRLDQLVDQRLEEVGSTCYARCPRVCDSLRNEESWIKHGFVI